MKRGEIFHRNSEILGSTSVFTGTRVSVDLLIQHLKHGKRIDEFLDDSLAFTRSRPKHF